MKGLETEQPCHFFMKSGNVENKLVYERVKTDLALLMMTFF